jgi:hypothetical protein
MAGWPFFVYPDSLAAPKRLAGSRLHPLKLNDFDAINYRSGLTTTVNIVFAHLPNP